jgi:hypothetical protein
MVPKVSQPQRQESVRKGAASVKAKFPFWGNS